PKLRNSTPQIERDAAWAKRHEQRRINLDVIRRFMRMPDHQLKFVLSAPSDMEEIDDLLAHLGPVDPSDVLLMPEGTAPAELDAREPWLVELCRTRGFRYCPRLQIRWFGHRRGT
ncbi:MAG: radical SAM protein, partial [Planctomycetota bacterium]